MRLLYVPEVCADTSYYALLNCFGTIILHISSFRLHSLAAIWLLVLIANTLKGQSLTSLSRPSQHSMLNTQKTSLEGKKFGVTCSYLLAILTVQCDPELSLVASVLRLSVVHGPVRYHLAFAFLLYAQCGNPPLFAKKLVHSCGIY